jgi:hypothetical protein
MRYILRAIADFNEAIRRDPNHPTVYDGRAKSHRARGDEANAARDEDRAPKRRLHGIQ